MFPLWPANGDVHLRISGWPLNAEMEGSMSGKVTGEKETCLEVRQVGDEMMPRASLRSKVRSW